MNFSRKNHEHHKTNRCFVSKKQLTFRFIFLIILSVLTFNTGCHNLYAQKVKQKVKKSKVRIKAQYVKIMDGEIFIDIKATAKIAKKNVKATGIKLKVYNQLDDEKISLGETITDRRGKSKFLLKNLNTIKPDSTNTYNILILFKGNEIYKKAKKSISFKNADLKAKMIIKDSINYITASLIDPITDSPIIDESLIVQVQRLLRPLKIGKKFNNTDENGTIIVPIEEGIPGVDGNLIIEVVLEDSDEYGTVKALVEAQVGTPIIDKSTFDQRTMWSPRSKTPIFLLIFPNLLIIGIWFIIVILIINLFKLSKS